MREIVQDFGPREAAHGLGFRGSRSERRLQALDIATLNPEPQIPKSSAPNPKPLTPRQGKRCSGCANKAAALRAMLNRIWDSGLGGPRFTGWYFEVP